MQDPTTHGTTQLQAWLDRMQAGDLCARNELLCALSDRLERLARKLLRRFPGVARWAQTDDVLQNSLLRLMRALQGVRPSSMRDFFGLAAEQMRRELLDLARHFYGPHGLGANHDSGRRLSETPGLAPDVAEEKDTADLEMWCAFHDQVAQLATEEREIVDLIFYHGCSQADVAKLLQVSVRTVQRRWQSALYSLHQALHDAKPRTANPAR